MHDAKWECFKVKPEAITDHPLLVQTLGHKRESPHPKNIKSSQSMAQCFANVASSSTGVNLNE